MNRWRPLVVSLGFCLVLTACGGVPEDARPSFAPTSNPATAATSVAPTTAAAPPTTPTPTTSTTTTLPPPAVTTGAARLVASNFAILDGQRVGLIANQASTVGGEHLVDVLNNAPNVELVRIFAPEHGLRGKGAAGEEIGDSLDPGSGLPIVSLYGEIRQPTADHLADIDVLVFDLQDVGSRFYTYIATMGLAMETAAQTGTRFVVLDRPNPVGGDTVGGYVLEEPQTSFIGPYPVPSQYAMTSGELARAVVGEAWMDNVEGLNVEVVELDGWTRDMLWPDTGLTWIPPSSGLPEFPSALAYPGSVLFEATELSYGGGTDEPFFRFGAPWADGDALAETLNAVGLPGVRFVPTTFSPRKLPRNSGEPRLTGEELHGVLLEFDDMYIFDPVATTVHVHSAFQTQASAAGEGSIINRQSAFDLLSGTKRLRRALDGGVAAEQILAEMQESFTPFLEQREPYLLYD